MKQKRNPVKLTWQQWIVCYVGSVTGGGLTWYATDNVWLGGGVLAVITAVYIFYLAGKATRGQQVDVVDPANLSRQQRRALERKNNKKNS